MREPTDPGISFPVTRAELPLMCSQAEGAHVFQSGHEMCRCWRARRWLDRGGRVRHMLADGGVAA